MRLIIFLLFVTTSALTWSNTTGYAPEDHSLEELWPTLTGLYKPPYPDANWVEEFAKKYPDAYATTKKNHNNNYDLVAHDLQKLWKMHFAGQYQEAYNLGNSLGIIGQIPALYSQLVFASTLDNKEQRWDLLNKIKKSLDSLTPLTADYSLAEFSNAYVRVRMLELMSTNAGRNSGYVPYVKKTLEKLHRLYPDEAIYLVTLGGFEAGVVERVGSWLSTTIFGISEQDALMAFTTAEKLSSHSSIYHLEYAIALSRLNLSHYQDKVESELNQCLTVKSNSAEEETAKQRCEAFINRLGKVN